MKPWRALRSRILLDRRWLRLREEHVVLPTGVEMEEFHVIESPDWAAIVALTAAGRVLLVDQYRRGIGTSSRELPAGVIDDGETPLQAAQRELLEETGHQAEHWQPLITVATEPARHTAQAHFFFARGALAVAEPRYDSTEHIEVLSATPDELLRWIHSGQIVHGLHIGAILLAAERSLLGCSTG